MEFILASHSPRRQELLRRILPMFRVVVQGIDETSTETSPSKYVSQLAHKKALAVQGATAIVIAADTTVVVDNAFLGKPQSEQDAVAMIKSLQGRSHHVYTGVAIVDQKTGRHITFAEKTSVVFAPMQDWEIKAYIATSEYKDKAGAYGIQGEMAKHISRIDGCYYNVMGLPVNALYEALKEFLGEAAYRAYLNNR